MAVRKFLVDIDFDQNEAIRMVLERLASAPAGTDGQLYYDTGTQLTYQYKGPSVNAWEVIGGSGTTNLTVTENASDVDIASSSGSGDNIDAATQSLAGVMTAADKVILDNLEINALLWTTTNLLTGGPGSSVWGSFLDEDNMASDSDQKVASQQSIKAYVDNAVVGAVTYKGGYNATTDTPALETTPGPLGILTGWMYTTTVGGTFFTATLEIGDVLIAENDAPTTEAEWTIVQRNETDVVSGPTSAVNNNVVFFDGTTGRLIKDSGLTLSGSNTGDEANASTTVKGIVEEATQTEVNNGTATGATGARLFVNPSTLDAWGDNNNYTARYETTVGDNASTSFVITHSLGNRFVQVQLFETLTPWRQVECQVDLTSTSQCTLDFNDIVATNLYTVIVIG